MLLAIVTKKDTHLTYHKVNRQTEDLAVALAANNGA